MRVFGGVVMISIAILQGCNTRESNESGTKAGTRPLFTLLPSSQTGIDFNNEVTDLEKFNILTYRNFYNGGGVAIGDINNDSLPDVYLTSNQGKNKLFLNKGNFVFEDITDKSGVAGTKVWSTGVTMADVNADGFLDIYVCNSGDVDGASRENELFINNGNLTFSERAGEYSLNNDGYGTHAAFFDYDLDGDLDCYILNNSFKDPARIELYKKVREQPDAGGDKLMRNDGNRFQDVTVEAGIYSSSIGFGLGVAVADLNQDHLPDIYISNDFWERDYLYINTGKGKFSEELIDRINYCSVSSMGADIADINNDGTLEIFTTDMLPADDYRLKTTMVFDPYHLEDTKYRANYHYQMVQNCLHLNDGAGRFQEIALLSGVSATDWSWGALIFDFENDGLKDIFISNGIQRNIMSMDFREFFADKEQKNLVLAGKDKLDQLDFISYIPAYPLKNYAFQNNGNLQFTNQADALGLSDSTFSNGTAYGDLDNDGDLDLVINNINSPCFVYRNEASENPGNAFLKVNFRGPAKNPFGIGAEVSIKTKGGVRVLQNFNTRGFESSIEPSLLFGLGPVQSIEELKVVWPDGKEQTMTGVLPNVTVTMDHGQASDVATPAGTRTNEYVEVSQKVIKGEATHVENRFNDFDQEILLPRMISTEGPRLVVGDVNGDKLDDFVLLGAAGDPDKLFVQAADATFRSKESLLLKDKGFESTCGALFDQDGDGDLDLMIGAGGNEASLEQIMYIVRLYKNDGRGNFSVDPQSIPPVIGNFSTLEACDFDRDGDVDVFLGSRIIPGNYGVSPRSFLLRNEPVGWSDATPSSLSTIGMVTDATWSDVDSDGDKDLVVVGDWLPVHVFINEGGALNPVVIPNSSGWWNRIEASDLDGDGDPDFVLGNWGLNTKFKASSAKPITMLVNDFDGNGKSEFIIDWYPPGDSVRYPFAQKSELTSQLPALRKSILKHADYANRPTDSLFSAEVLKASTRYSAGYMESAILWNDADGFTLSALPQEAQVSPVFGIAVNDFNEDGITDIWLGGNFYALKPQVGRHDASRGALLLGGPERTFKFQPQSQIDLYVPGEVRDAVVFRSANLWQLLVARNNDRVLVFRKSKPRL